MFGCRSAVQMAPSRGLFSPTKRNSNLAVFSLSRSFKQTVRPRLLSRTRQTFDMLPWPVRFKRSNRLRMSIFGRLILGLDLSQLNRPTDNLASRQPPRITRITRIREERYQKPVL